MPASRASTPTSPAAWEWRFGWRSHRGEHATSALRALYRLKRGAASA